MLKLITIDALLVTLVLSLTIINVGRSSPDPVIYVDPPIYWGKPGEPVNVDVKIKDVVSSARLYAWEFDMSFNPSIIKVLEETDTADNELANGTVRVKQLPWANFTISPAPPYVIRQDLTFNASSSTPDGGELIEPSSYFWNFGDLSTAYGNVTTHKYTSTGNFTVTLNVTDTEGLWDTESQTITIYKSLSAVSSTEGLVGKTVTSETDTAENALVDGVSTTSGSPIRDIAVTKVVFNTSTVVGAYNQAVSIKITVQNNPLGYQRETFRVLAYANTTNVGETTGSLNPGESATYTILWNTTSFTPAGIYTIKGRVPQLRGVSEGPFLKSAGNTAWWWLPPRVDNVKGTVIASDALLPMKYPGGAVGDGTLATVFFEVIVEGKSPLHFYYTALRTYNGVDVLDIPHTSVDGVFTILGDVDGDGDVDGLDLIDLSKAYGSVTSKPNWNQNCDFNRDNKVDVSDLFNLSRNYGKKS